MHAHVFANLPVAGLERRKRFFVALGDRPNPQCSGGSAACIVLGEQIVAMLLVKDHFQTFTPKPIADSTTTTEVLTALSCTSADEVRRLCELSFTHAVAASANRRTSASCSRGRSKTPMAASASWCR